MEEMFETAVSWAAMSWLKEGQVMTMTTIPISWKVLVK